MRGCTCAARGDPAGGGGWCVILFILPRSPGSHTHTVVARVEDESEKGRKRKRKTKSNGAQADEGCHTLDGRAGPKSENVVLQKSESPFSPFSVPRSLFPALVSGLHCLDFSILSYFNMSLNAHDIALLFHLQQSTTCTAFSPNAPRSHNVSRRRALLLHRGTLRYRLMPVTSRTGRCRCGSASGTVGTGGATMRGTMNSSQV